MTSITIYDGVNTIGGNKIYVESGGRGVFLDFGVNFVKYNMFFQDFLTERSSRGIHDLIHLKLIPKLNIYREDLIPSDLDIASYPALNVEAILLSHAHVDHCGNIALLKKSIPILATKTTVAILKALRDTDISPKIGSEVFYMSTREKAEGTNGLVLESPSKGIYETRNFHCTSEPPNRLREFCSYRPGQESRNVKKVISHELQSLDKLRIPFKVDAYDVDHSIYGAAAYILRGDIIIAYTGDFRLHGKNAQKTDQFVKAAKNASVLITEGTRIGREEESNVSEEQVFENCRAAVEGSDKLTVADFSARNFERLEMFLKIAKQLGKTLVVSPKDAYMLYAIGCAEGNCIMDNKEISIYEELKKKDRYKWETNIIKNNWNDRYVTPMEIRQDLSRYILCFSFFDLKHLLDIKPEGGSYIYSSSEAFSEEQSFDFIRLNHWLNFFGLKTYGFELKGSGDSLHPEFVKGFHASGHVSKDEVLKVIDEIDPDLIIPIHTEKPEWFKQHFDNVIIPEEGKAIEL